MSRSSSQMRSEMRPAKQFLEDFFVYEVDTVGGLAPNATAALNFQVQADSDFKWIKSAYVADIAAAAYDDSTRPIPNVTVLITDTGSGRQLMSVAAPIPNLFGTGQLPFIMPVPRIFKARSSVAVTLANYDAAVTYNIRLSFIGTKLFEMGPG